MDWLTNLQSWLTIAGGISLLLGVTLSARYRYIKQLDDDTITSLKNRLAIEETRNVELERLVTSKEAHIAELTPIAQQTPAVTNLIKEVAALTKVVAKKADK